MLFSVITVTYNRVDFLRRTFNSVLNQKGVKIELVVIDGASTDGSLDVIKEYELLFEGRMKWKSELDTGMYEARNKGIEMATGEIIGFLNSDDFFTKDDVLFSMKKEFETHPDLDAVYGDVHFVRVSNLERCVRYYSSRIFRPALMRIGFMPAHPSFYMRRECYERYGLYKMHYRICADFELLLRYIMVHKIRMKYLQKDMVTMCMGGISTQGLVSHRCIMKEHLYAFKENHLYTNCLLLSLRYLYKIGEVLISKIRYYG